MSDEEIEEKGARGNSSAVRDALARVTAGLPGGGEERPGQVEMALAVVRAIQTDHHLAVQAGTGTGKSLAYLVPSILSGRRTVVATATKALQDQLAQKDLPSLAGSLGTRFTFSVLKGRSNYLCRQKVREVSGRELSGDGTPADGADQLALDAVDVVDVVAPETLDSTGSGGNNERPRRFVDDLKRLIAWSDRTHTGDASELDYEPDPRAWAALTTTSRECPGVSKCPSGSTCFAEAARQRAASVDVIVTNTHLYGAHLASDGGVLPPHDVVVFDEAHQLEDVATTALGIEVSGGSFRALARQMRPLLGKDGTDLADKVGEAGELIETAAMRATGDAGDGGTPGGRLVNGLRGDLHQAITTAQERLGRATAAVRAADVTADTGVQHSLSPSLGGAAIGGSGGPREAAKQRALQGASSLATDLVRLLGAGEDDVVWIEGADRSPVVKLAPIDVRAALATRLWPGVTAVLTSATLPTGLVERLGLSSSGRESARTHGDPLDGDLSATVLDVGSPFPYRTHALLYCAAHLPDPRVPGAGEALHNELVALIGASGGRALGLFTSWRAMRAALDAVRSRIPYTLLAQGDLPKHELLRRFTAEEESCLFATMSFWQGVDVPGAALSLVAIDRIPFPRPDEPLAAARRDRAGARAFYAVDIPRAATLLAQGSGRLIRTATDRGVVAVLDPRLAKASYRKALLAALPPMRRTVNLADVERFFAAS